MAISLSAPSATELKPRILVFGVGGGGCNAVNNMIQAGLDGVDFIVANTDAQQLAYAKTDRRIQLGVRVTEGLGAGAHPEIGMKAAEESLDEINAHLDGAHMVFITAGMGGGTGTGAAPVIARAARDRGILTIGVVTKPFHFEQRHRMRLAEAGIVDLQREVDTLIIIPNQNLFRVANEKTTFAEAFSMADRVLHSGVRSITDLMVMPGLINLDFADVRTVMSEMGKAMMGTGEAAGEDRALVAAQNAIANPLLDEVSLKGAKAVLVNVTGSFDMTLLEVDEAANAITAEVDPEANIIFGAAFDPTLEGKIRVSVVATGMEGSLQTLEPRVTRPAPVAARPPEPIRMPEPVAIRAPEPVRHHEMPTAAMIQAPRPTPTPPREPVYYAPETPMYADPAPVAARAEPEPEPVAVEAAPEPQPDIFDQRSAAQLQPEPEAPRLRPAAEAPRHPFEPAPSFRDEPRYDDKKKGGFLSLFGNKSTRAPYQEPEPAYRQPAAPARGNAAVAAAPQSTPAEEPLDATDDLDIPSFLRRLAN